MNCIGIDPRANRFTRCYRTGMSKVEDRNNRKMKTFDLTAEGLAALVMKARARPAYRHVPLLMKPGYNR